MNNLATWWCQATPGTTYVRCQVPARHLPGHIEHLGADSLQYDEHGEPFVFGQDGYASIWQFPGNATRGIIMSELQEQGHKVLIEVDDNYLKPPPNVRGLLNDWSKKLDRSPADMHSFQAHAKLVKWCDGVIVTTPELASRYEGATPAPIYVCPNSMDMSDWPVFAREDEWDDMQKRVGYAGSDSHAYDMALIDDAIDWAFRDGAALVKIGISKEWRWEHTQVPWANEPRDYRLNLSCAFDIGLCPLKRGEWQDCKSDIKAMEYLASGILPVVQGDSPVYADWVDLVPSASTPKQWTKVTRELLQLPMSEIRAMHDRAYTWMLENKTIQSHINKWQEAVA